MASVKEIYNKYVVQYDHHPYCSFESLGSVTEFATQRHFRNCGIDLKGKIRV